MTHAPVLPRSVGVVLGLLVVLLSAGVALAPSAAAHAVLLDTTPGDGEALEAAPTEVTLRFNERVDLPPQAVRVFDAAGERVDAGSAGLADATTVAAPVADDLGDGLYVVAWRVISADSHPIRGSFTFIVGDADAVDPAAAAGLDLDADTAGWASTAGALARWVMYTGTLLAVGGAVFLVLAHDRASGERDRLVRIVTWAAVAGVVGTVVGVPLQAVLASGLGAAALTDGALLRDTLASGHGLSAMVRVAGLTVLLLGAARLWDGWAVGAVSTGALATVASFLLTGHTAASEPRALVLASNLLHTATAAIWFGGLVLLAIVLRARRRADGDAVVGARMVARFSTLALGSVVVVSLAGFALAWVEVRTLRGLTTTAYGWTLIAKVVLVAGIVALGAYNNRRLVPAIRRGADRAWQRLSAIVRLEAGGVVAVLLVTAFLVNIVPARVEAGIGEPFSDYLALGDDHQVNLVIDPAQPGRNELHLYLLDDAGRPADIGQEVEVRFSLPEAEIDNITREPVVAGPGHYVLVGSEMAIPGIWDVEVRVLVSDFELLTTTAEVPIGVGG
jgi:copper transport protein